MSKHDYATAEEAIIGAMLEAGYPKRGPWANLGDKLAVEMPGTEHEGLIEPLARALYCEHGVRVTGGEEP